MKKQSAFLLSEHITALSVFILSISLIVSLFKILLTVEKQLFVPDSLEWHLMILQMDDQLLGYKLDFDAYIDTTLNKREEKRLRLYPKNDPHTSHFDLQYHNGNLPLMYGYQLFKIRKEGEAMLLRATLLQGESYQIYFIPANRTIRAIKMEYESPITHQEALRETKEFVNEHLQKSGSEQ